MNLREYAAQSKAENQEECSDTSKGFEGMGYLMQEQAREKADRERAREICFQYNRARVNAENIVSEILKGSKRAENPFVLLQMAAECISLLTDDNNFFAKQIESAIIEEYAQKQNNSDAMQFESVVLTEQLERLSRADHQQKPNVIELINAKKQRLAEIKSKLKIE